MPLKNSNTVAVERRMDLASLFCMISRHGPAVALAVIAMVSVLAGFIIYRTVRGKRRKATADGDSGSPAAESQPSPEESHSSAESTDMRDEGPSDLKEDADLIQSDLKIRHRRAAAAAVAPEKPSPPRSHPETDIQALDPEHTTSDDTGEREVVWNSHKAAETYSGEPLQGLSSDIYAAAEVMVVEDDVDCHQDATDDVVEDVMETVADHDSCLREPELINDENHDEEEKVLKEECQEAEDVTTDEDVSDMNTRQEEETFQHTLNNPVCFQQTSDMGEMGEDDMLQDNKTTLETNGLESKFEEPVVHDEDVPAPCICSGKDEQFEEGRPDSIDCSSYFGNNSLSPEAEEKNEGERAEEEFLIDSLVPQQPELLSSIDQDTGPTSTEQDLSDHLMDKVMPPTGGKLDEDDDLTTEVIEEVLDEDHVNTLTAIKIDDHSPRCSEKEVEIEQKQENGHDHEDGGLDDGVDQAKEKMLTSDDTVASSEESDSTTVALLCLGTPVNVDGHDDGLPSIAIDAKVQIAGVAHIPDLSLGCQPKSEDEIAPSLDDKSRYSANNSLSPEEEKESEDKMPEGECVDTQQVEILSSTFEQETYLPSAEQDQSDHIMEKGMPPIGDSDVVADDGPAGELNKEVVNEDQLKKLTADTHSPQFDDQEVEIDQHKQDGLNQEDGVLDDGADQVKGKTLTCDNVVVDSEEGELSDDHVNSLLGITTDANAQISGIADSRDMSLGCQPQSDDKILPSLDEDKDFTVLALETENLTEENKNDQTVLLAEECKGQVHDPESVQMINDEVFDKASVAANPDPVEYLTASVVVEEIPCPYPPFICQDEKNDCKENDGTLDTMRIDSATDAVHCNDMNHTALSISEEICHPDILSSSQDQQSDHMENNEVATSAAPIMTKDISLPMCQIYLPSLEQSEQKYSEILSPSVGAESGISSMAVSPDLQDAGNGFDVTVQNMVLPVMDYDLKLDGQTRAHNSLYTDDAVVSVTYKNTAGMVFGPYPSYSSQKPHNESTDWTKYESFAANEDMFGHEIEDSYHRAMDQYAAQIAVSVASHVDDLKIQREIKIEAVEIKEKKAGVSTKKKEDPNAEEKEEDNDRTEISIMEATMDNNEWITESNYQVLPWMNLSTPSLAQDDTKTNQLPTEDSQQSSTTCTDMTDIQTSAEVKQTTTLSDENMDTNKKVVAVQPMPQNVNVTFRVHYFTQSPYQTVAVTGNQPELGSWKGFIPLERGKDGHWATVVSLPAESHVEWKFVLLDKGEVCRWEECGNHLLDTGFGDDLLVHKWWGLM